MASVRFDDARTHSVIVSLACCTVIWIAGCSGSGDGTTDGPVASTADCATTTADALVSVDGDENTSLVASAITSDCDEVAVYEDGGRVSQAAVSLGDGGQVVAEFNADGEVVAVRSGAGNRGTVRTPQR